MTGFIIFVHTVICILLVIVVLMQTGRGGGLTEGFASAESMLGAQTNVFMTRTTTILSVVFFVTCLSLAFISSQKGKSLMSDVAPEESVLGTTSEALESLVEEQVESVDDANSEANLTEETQDASQQKIQTPEPAIPGENQDLP